MAREKKMQRLAAYSKGGVKGDVAIVDGFGVLHTSTTQARQGIEHCRERSDGRAKEARGREKEKGRTAWAEKAGEGDNNDLNDGFAVPRLSMVVKQSFFLAVTGFAAVDAVGAVDEEVGCLII